MTNALLTVLKTNVLSLVSGLVTMRRLKLIGPGGKRPKVAPGLALATVGHLFGNIWRRPGLTMPERSLVTLTALAALHRTEEMRLHFVGARNLGLPRHVLEEMILHIAYDAGWPCATNAGTVLNQVWKNTGITGALATASSNRTNGELDMPPPDAAILAGMDLMRRLGLDSSTETDAGASTVALADATVKHLFGTVWTRPGLELPERILITLTALVALNREEAMHAQFGVAYRLGIPRRMLEEMILHVAHYAGWPCAISANRVLNEVWSEEERNTARP